MADPDKPSSNSEAVPAVRAGVELSPEMRQRAVDLILAGLGKAELELAVTYPVPLYWAMRGCDGQERIKGGTAFFLDTGETTFGVTAAHVVTEYFEDTKSPSFVQVMLGTNGRIALPMFLGDRIIDANAAIDIATFRVSREEIAYVNTQRVSRLRQGVAAETNRD